MTDKNGKSAAVPRDPLDRATAARLAQLKNLPLELSNLENRVRAEVGPPPRCSCCGGWLKAHRLVVGVAIAAAIVAIVLLIAREMSH
jgi:hypothetical protein